MTDETKHAEGFSASTSQSTGNPVTKSLNIVVSVPDSIEIRMVDASVLADYEIWFFISSILSSAVIGFLVSFIQALNSTPPQNAPLWGYTTLVFSILLVISVVMTFCKRKTLKKRGKDIKLKATEETLE